ncbi:hypothetical protein ALP34_200129 [Pseudomonas savastanoi pv. glycinea]|nr:hypothetical protein ALP34_200129 [Pseudomonas savastanoi pv. glycinea]
MGSLNTIFSSVMALILSALDSINYYWKPMFLEFNFLTQTCIYLEKNMKAINFLSPPQDLALLIKKNQKMSRL